MSARCFERQRGAPSSNPRYKPGEEIVFSYGDKEKGGVSPVQFSSHGTSSIGQRCLAASAWFCGRGGS